MWHRIRLRGLAACAMLVCMCGIAAAAGLAAPPEAPERVALRGVWLNPPPGGTAIAGAAAPHAQAFDPDRLTSFGRARAGARLLLSPAHGRWPDGTYVLSVGSPGFQQVTLHQPGAPPRRGRLLAPERSQWPAHGRLVFELPALPADGAPLRLHVDAHDAIPSPLTFELRAVSSHLRADAQRLAFATACLTTMAATALIALFFGLRLKDSAFGYYSVYVLGYVAIQAAQTGYIAHPLEWDAAARTLPAWGRAVTAVSVIAAVLFLDRFTDLARVLPGARRWLHAYCGLMLLLLIAGYVPALQPAARQLINPLLIVGGPLLLVIALAAAIRRSRYAALFLVGWLPLLTITAIGSLQLYGLAADWTWTGEAALAAGAFEAIVLSLGLAERAASLRTQRDRAEARAELDPLTGVLNRRAWDAAAARLRETAGSRPMAVLFLDLDHFKQVNDQLGHDGGDQALLLFVDAVNAVLRGRDLVGRYGGEEFVVALPATDQAQAVTIANRIRERFTRAAEESALGVRLTVSVGVGAHAEGEPFAALMRRADSALYAAKGAGRDCVAVA